MVLKYFGIDQDEVSLTMLCKTTLAGTGLAEIVDAAQHLGFQGAWKIGALIADLTTTLKRGIPIMTVVDARVLHGVEMSKPSGHMIVIYSMDDNMIFYHDPEIGPNQLVSQSIFIESWENLRKRMVTIWPKKEMTKKRSRP
jgi:ABC-type bacteriocin/lantibiotic exporter with double-glycine peptidase domain